MMPLFLGAHIREEGPGDQSAAISKRPTGGIVGGPRIHHGGTEDTEF